MNQTTGTAGGTPAVPVLAFRQSQKLVFFFAAADSSFGS
jgi:hypothetical protein